MPSRMLTIYTSSDFKPSLVEFLSYVKTTAVCISCHPSLLGTLSTLILTYTVLRPCLSFPDDFVMAPQNNRW